MFPLSVWVLNFDTNLKKKHSKPKFNLNRFISTSETIFEKLLGIREYQEKIGDSDNFNNFKVYIYKRIQMIHTGHLHALVTQKVYRLTRRIPSEMID